MDDVNNIKSIVSDVLAQYNVELVDFNLHLLRRAYKIKVVVSKKQGITLDECVKLNKEIAARIEQNNEDNFLYDLEVSSPGLDRVLKKEKDFIWAIGKGVKISTKELVLNKRCFNGVIKNVAKGCIVLDMTEESLSIELDNILKAKLEVR